MRSANRRFFTSSLFVVALSGVLVLPAAAESQCKGLSENSCAVDSACAWVEGYVRKDGRSVSSHCKTRPGQKAQKGIDPKAPKVGALR